MRVQQEEGRIKKVARAERAMTSGWEHSAQVSMARFAAKLFPPGSHAPCSTTSRDP